MKLVCEREKLLYAFQIAAAVASTRTPKPILENIKLEATPEATTVMATDLEIGIRIDVGGIEVEAGGSVVLPIKRVGGILRESSDSKLTIESDGTKTLIFGDRSEFQLPTQNPDEFPPVPAFAEHAYHDVPARFFREMLRRTVFATDSESSHYALGGVLLELNADQIIGVGTDGRRLAMQEGPAEAVNGHKTTNSTVIPSKAVKLMERALADNDENVQLAVRENSVVLRSRQTTIFSRLVEGRYPRWRDVFPGRSDMVRIEMNVGPFLTAVRQAAIVTSEERRGLDFQFGEGKLVLIGHGAELGESEVELPIGYDGGKLPVKLDPRYLVDFLQVLDPDTTISLHVRDSQSAIVCDTADRYSYVIMPLFRE
ncbi:MAG: DNA polymerase III subunit beta [Thermoguttaceae bacterium]